MSTSNCIIALVITSLPLMASPPKKLSDRIQDGELQHTFCASRDGYALLQRLVENELPSNLILASIAEAKQSLPVYLASDPKYNSDPPKRPQLTSFKIKVFKGKATAKTNVPELVRWDELVPSSAWNGPHYTAYKALTEAGFDPFAHDGEIAFRFEESKQGRNQFTDLFIIPDGWGEQIGSAVTWRLENKLLFESIILTKVQVAALHTNAESGNPLIKKMSVSLLMRHNAASAEDMKMWLRSEPSLVDTAVTVQLILARDAKSSVVTTPSWMVAEGELIWGGALIGATLVFAENEKAVTSMMYYHAKLREAKQVQSGEINAFREAAKNQIGYVTIEGIGAELIRTNVIRNYPMFSAANQILSSTYIIDRALLFFDAKPLGE